jgi:hypothetical protein
MRRNFSGGMSLAQRLQKLISVPAVGEAPREHHAVRVVQRMIGCSTPQMLWNAALNDKIQPPAVKNMHKFQGLHNSAWLWQHGAALAGGPTKHQAFH